MHQQQAYNLYCQQLCKFYWQMVCMPYLQIIGLLSETKLEYNSLNKVSVTIDDLF